MLYLYSNLKDKYMFSEELEALISAAFIDGTISDKERAILIKRAVAEGIDPDEFELILDSRIIMASKNNEAPKKSSGLGEVRKCPSCASPVGAFQVRCAYCGFEFSGVAPNPFVQKFADGLHKAVTDASKSVRMSAFDKFFDSTGQDEENRKQTAMSRAETLYVRTSPLPLAKEDIIEMLTFMTPKIKAGGATEVTLVWRNKFEALLSKLEVIAATDPSLQPLVNHYRKQLKVGFFGRFYIGWKSMSKTARVLIWLLLFYIVFFSVIGFVLVVF